MKDIDRKLLFRKALPEILGPGRRKKSEPIKPMPASLYQMILHLGEWADIRPSDLKGIAQYFGVEIEGATRTRNGHRGKEYFTRATKLNTSGDFPHRREVAYFRFMRS